MIDMSENYCVYSINKKFCPKSSSAVLIIIAGHPQNNVLHNQCTVSNVSHFWKHFWKAISAISAIRSIIATWNHCFKCFSILKTFLEGNFRDICKSLLHSCLEPLFSCCNHCSVPAQWCPFSASFIVGNRKKSQVIKSGIWHMWQHWVIWWHA